VRNAGLARMSASRTANSFTDRSSGRPSRAAVCRWGSSSILAEAIALSLIDGAAGIITGAAATTAIYAHGKGWATVIPTDAWTGGLAAAILIGALAGLLPAIRAARLSPTQALWSI
jgi:hypothetical protein